MNITENLRSLPAACRNSIAASVFCVAMVCGASGVLAQPLPADSVALSALNKQFIENFIRQDAVRHAAIIHPDFVCIEPDGHIVGRDEYLKGWATAYRRSGYTSFGYTDEVIRIFGNMALVRSKTVYTKMVDGKEVKRNSLYTDTYVKEGGVWKCVQAQLTPVK